MDTDSTLQEYQIQLEQVEIALKSDPDNEELSRLKIDLLEVITLTKELLEEENEANNAKKKGQEKNSIQWRSGMKCMALWRTDGKYYPGKLDQVLEDGTCTVIFEDSFGHNNEISQVSQLKPYDAEAAANIKRGIASKTSTMGKGNAFSKKELELKLREAKKRKKEKFQEKIKVQEQISEKSKNNWKDFNAKLSAKTWKGVVSKNKFVVPDNHESKVGVGTNSLSNRVVTANGTLVASQTSAAASAALISSAKRQKTNRY